MRDPEENFESLYSLASHGGTVMSPRAGKSFHPYPLSAPAAERVP